jgi:hypothetical protein
LLNEQIGRLNIFISKQQNYIESFLAGQSYDMERRWGMLDVRFGVDVGWSDGLIYLYI